MDFNQFHRSACNNVSQQPGKMQGKAMGSGFAPQAIPGT
jgi:hypothetical protein